MVGISPRTATALIYSNINELSPPNMRNTHGLGLLIFKTAGGAAAVTSMTNFSRTKINRLWVRHWQLHGMLVTGSSAATPGNTCSS
jgi:hypothetical protein